MGLCWPIPNPGWENVKSVAVEVKENTSTGCQLELLLPARTPSL